jgi:hypothetical protein
MMQLVLLLVLFKLNIIIYAMAPTTNQSSTPRHIYANKNGPVHKRPTHMEKNSDFIRTNTDTNTDKHSTFRVAVLVAGGFLRYFLESSANRLVAPLVRQKHSVDYFLSLTTEAAKPYRASFGYTHRATWDPVFSSNALGDLDCSMPNHTVITDTVSKVMARAGARLREFTLHDHIDVEADARIRKRHQKSMIRHPSEDPDLRFPTYDLGSAADHSSNIVANRNLLRLHLSMERLWLAALKTEEQDGSLYHFVLFLRDDTKWLLNFDLNKLLAQGPADVYLPSCDARKPPMPPDEINDHGLVASRRAADVFGFYLGRLLNSTFDKCKESWNYNILPTLDAKDFHKMIQNKDIHAFFYGRRGCNSEMLLKWQLDRSRLKVRKVGQAMIPFQRSMHLNMSGNVVECFHKYCSSFKGGLRDFGIQRCSAINLDG